MAVRLQMPSRFFFPIPAQFQYGRSLQRLELARAMAVNQSCHASRSSNAVDLVNVLSLEKDDSSLARSNWILSLSLRTPLF